MTAFVLDSDGRLSPLLEEADLLSESSDRARRSVRISAEDQAAALDFTAGIDPVKGSDGNVVAVEEVGLGRPLTIEIAEIYTGRFPKWWSKDLLVTTAVKAKETFDAQPRALNFLEPGIGQRTRLSIPRPTQKGTPYAFYSPALVSRSLSFQIEFVFDEIPDEWFSALSGALGQLAGIPMFIGSAGYLIAGSSLINLGGNILNALFDHQHSFRSAVPLNIYTPGVAPLSAGWYLLTDDSPENRDGEFDPRKYRIDEAGRLVGPSGAPYAGNMPYATALIDGTERAELASFAPRAVSADLLSRFLGNKSVGETGIDALVEATKLYSDIRFLDKAKGIADQYGQTTDPDLRKRLQNEYAALQKNIGSGDIRKVLPALK
jgi:hypothetical protein